MTAMTSKENSCETHSPEETVALGRTLGESYPDGGSFYLEGELGTGKTLLAKGIASAYGVDPNQVVSPTFALVNRYTGDGRMVYHVDLYRIENERELFELGLEEIDEEERAALIVEWAEKLGPLRLRDAVDVHLESLEGDSRRICIIQLREETS